MSETISVRIPKDEVEAFEAAFQIVQKKYALVTELVDRDEEGNKYKVNAHGDPKALFYLGYHYNNLKKSSELQPPD